MQPQALIKELQVFKIFYGMDLDNFESPPPNHDVKGVPSILGVMYNESIGEIKMEYCGVTMSEYMKTPEYELISNLERMQLVFEMMR